MAEERGKGSPSEIDALRNRIEELEAELEQYRDFEDEVERLRQSEAELRAMFHAMNDVVLVIDGDGLYLKIAPTAPDLLYKPSDELLGKTLHEAFPREMADFFLSSIRRSLESQDVVTVDYMMPIEDREVFFTANLCPMSDNAVVIVARDVSERKRAEETLTERAIQDERLRTQEETLDSLSTPLIPLSDDLLVMPLVGDLTDRRMGAVVKTLLDGIAYHTAEVVILDITGVPVVDSQVTSILVETAYAAQMLGADVILTGIQPEVAHALVALRIDLSGIVTRGTLQEGIKYAMMLRDRSRTTAAFPPLCLRYSSESVQPSRPLGQSVTTSRYSPGAVRPAGLV